MIVLWLSFMNLFRNRRRTLAILMTIALGTGVLFSFKGFIHGVLSDYRESTIHSHYGHGQINTKHYRETVYDKPWEHWIDKSNEVEHFLTSHPLVKQVFPRNYFSALLKKGNVSVNGFGHGIMAEREAEFFHGLQIEIGEPLSKEPKGLVLGIGLAKALGVKPGDTVKVQVNGIDGTLNETEFVITGIFHTGTMDFDNRIFRVQLDQAQALLKTDKIELISLGLNSHLEWQQFANDFQNAFPDLEAISFEELDKVYYKHSVEWLNAQFQVIQIIILAIVVLGIFNSVSASILERKQEIGNFRANGESVLDIMKLITVEGLFLGLLGSCLGVALSYGVIKLFLDQGILMPPGPGLTKSFYISFQFEWVMAYTSVIWNGTAAILASILAGLRVARMPIAAALRS